ncbi:MAG: hypothetical protein AAF497_06235, partial [Planctomycetota bacterium]
MRCDCRVFSPSVWAAHLILAIPVLAVGQGADVISTWGGTVGGWSDASRWSSAWAPNNGNGGLTYDAVILSGTVTLSSPITIESLHLANGMIDDASGQNLTVLNEFDWTSGSLFGSGSLNANNVVLDNATKFLSRNLRVGGVADWRAGSLAFQVNQGSVELLSGSRLNVSGTNSRTMTVDLNVQAGATLNHNTPGTTTHGGFGSAFVNEGVININDGTFAISGPSSGSGDFNVAAPATFQVRSGTADIAGNVSGDGTLQATSGMFNLNAGSTFTVTNLVTTGGQVAFNTGTPVSIPSVTTAATIDGGDDLSIGTMTWTSGNLRGSGGTTVDTLVLDGSNKFLDRNLAVSNRATWNRGSISFSSSAGSFEVLSGALLEIAGTQNRTMSNGLTVHSGATVQQSFDGVVTLGLFNSPLVNNGRMNIDNGELALTGNGTGSGLFSIDNGCALRITGGLHSFSGEIEGEGTVEFRSGTTSFTAGANYQPALTEIRGTVAFDTGDLVQVADVIQTAGTLQGADEVRIGFFEWIGGAQSGSGTTIVDGGKFSAQLKQLERTLRIVGDTVWESGNIAFSSNQGTLQVEQGRFSVTGDRDRAMSVHLEIMPGATLNHQSSGTTTLGQFGSTLTNDGTIRVEAGRLNSFDGFTNFDAASRTLTGGSYDLSGEFRFRDADVVTNEAELILRPGWAITDRNGADGLADFSVNGVNGIFRMREDVQFGVGGSINNRGLFDIENGQLSVDDLQNETSGTVSGEGTVFGDVNNEGQVQPGHGIGRLELQGEYLQTDSGTLEIEYGGLVPIGEHDLLEVFESATLAGDLRIVP